MSLVIGPSGTCTFISPKDNRRIMANIITEGSTTPDLLAFHHKRLYRLVEECLDVSFILCNSELEEFGIAKIFDVFDQTIGTAFVLNTGFWPFFNTISGQCICVCGRFGILCRHVKNSYHWIDMSPIQDSGAIRFYPKQLGNVHPREYSLLITPISDDTLGYNIVLDLKLHYRKSDKGKPRRANRLKKKDLDAPDSNNIVTTFRARYNLTPEYYPAFATIIFEPSPFYQEHYGSYMEKLIDKRRTLQWSNANDGEKCFTVAINQMPTSSLILNQCNLPVYDVVTQIIAIFPRCQPVRKYQRSKKNKSLQTPWIIKVSNEDEYQLDHYSQKLKEVELVWRYDETFYNISDSIRTITKLPQPMEEIAIKREPIENSDDYDNQFPLFGFDKIIRAPAVTDENANFENSCYWMSNYPQNDDHLKYNQPLPNSYEESNQGAKRKYNSQIQRPLLSPDSKSSITDMRNNDATTNNEERSPPRPSSIPFYLHPDSFPPLTNEITSNNIIFDKSYSNALKTPKPRASEKLVGDYDYFDLKYFRASKRSKPMTHKEIDEEYNIIEEVIVNDLTE